jgi:peptide-methionine (S)-S-oxide reductase
MLKGVSKVLPGYAGGTVQNPTYDQVSMGKTGHAEVVYIEYDPTQVEYKTLLTIFFASHDSTTLNRQGNDVGTQYRSAIFSTTAEQATEAQAFIDNLNATSAEGSKIVTTVEPLTKFYEAENYHHDYFAAHPDAAYCQLVINPKLEKIQKKYAELLKTL